MSKISRNDPCPCGSGKKYKKCCLNREDQAWTEWFAADCALGQQRLEEQKRAQAKQAENS
jgi:hypothetical protein